MTGPSPRKTALLIDGGTGMELILRSQNKTPKLWSAQYLLSEPNLVQQVHEDYIAAGARIITINAYSASWTRMALVEQEEQVPLLQRRACELALAARDRAGEAGSRVRVAGCLPPLNGSYRADRVRDFDTNRAEYLRLVELQAPHVDLFICETMSSALEAHAAATAALSSGKPVWVAFTLEDRGPKLRSGETLAQAMQALVGLPIQAVLANCCPPESISQAMDALIATGLPTGGYANGFMEIPKMFMPGKTRLVLRSRQDLDPQAYAGFAAQWLQEGARIIGGCCEVGPRHIARLQELLLEGGYDIVSDIP